MLLKISSVAVGLTLLSAVSLAPQAGARNLTAGPPLSGTYIVVYSEICQAQQVGLEPGKVTTESMTLTFNTSNGTAKYSGAKVSGGLVVWKGVTGGLRRSLVSGTWTYSNTTTTLTINGAKFDVKYGPAKNLVPQSLVFTGIPSTGCAASATAILQRAS